MIDPKELRIGNLIEAYFQDEDRWKEHVVSIESLRHILNGSKNYRPIPLTEERLLQCGFELESWLYKYRYSAEAKLIEGYVKDKVWCFMPHKDYALAYFGRRIKVSEDAWEFSGREGSHSVGEQIDEAVYKVVIYLHKFQNLYYSLTGQELEFKSNS